MSLDDATANDATLIDDDLVASLGFEPTTTIEPVVGDVLDVRSDVAEFVPTEEPASADAAVIDLEDPVEAPVVDADHDADSDLDEPEAVVADVEEAVAEAETDEPESDEPLEDVLLAGEVAVEQGTDDQGTDDDVAIDLGAVDDLVLDDEAPLFGSVGSPLIAIFDETDEPAVDEVAVDSGLDEPEAVVADTVETAPADDVELFDVADDDDLGDAVIDLDTDDLDVPQDLGLESRVDAETAAAGSVVVDEAIISSSADGAESLATLDEVFAPAPDISVPEAATVTVPAVAASAAVAPAGKRRGKLRARKVRRVIRHVDPWSVLTFSVLFHLVFFSSMLLASILVWNGAVQAGTIDNIENFIRELGDYETFNINSDVVFRAAVVIAGMLTLASSIIVVLLTVVFNLVSDLVGGIRVTVIEEDTVVVPSAE